MPKITEREIVFSTPWFSVVSKTVSDKNPNAPFYSLTLDDYVTILALTEQQEMLLVRQYRPAIEAYTLELPSGHVDKGELPEVSAKRELLEETGYSAEQVELLGCLMPDTGRLSNRQWCYFARDVKPSLSKVELEEGLELVVCSLDELNRYIMEGQILISLHLAVVSLALLKNKLPTLLQPFRP